MKKTPEQKTLIARVPAALLRKIDAAAKQADRTRSAELRVRLEASFATARQGAR